MCKKKFGFKSGCSGVFFGNTGGSQKFFFISQVGMDEVGLRPFYATKVPNKPLGKKRSGQIWDGL